MKSHRIQVSMQYLHIRPHSKDTEPPLRPGMYHALTWTHWEGPCFLVLVSSLRPNVWAVESLSSPSRIVSTNKVSLPVDCYCRVPGALEFQEPKAQKHLLHGLLLERTCDAEQSSSLKLLFHIHKLWWRHMSRTGLWGEGIFSNSKSCHPKSTKNQDSCQAVGVPFPEGPDTLLLTWVFVSGPSGVVETYSFATRPVF